MRKIDLTEKTDMKKYFFCLWITACSTDTTNIKPEETSKVIIDGCNQLEFQVIQKEKIKAVDNYPNLAIEIYRNQGSVTLDLENDVNIMITQINKYVAVNNVPIKAIKKNSLCHKVMDEAFSHKRNLSTIKNNWLNQRKKDPEIILVKDCYQEAETLSDLYLEQNTQNSNDELLINNINMAKHFYFECLEHNANKAPETK